MVITFAGITVSCIASLLFTPIHLTPHRPDKGLLVTLNNIVVKHQIATPEKTKPVAALKPALAGKTNQFLPFVLKPDSQTSNLPLNIDLNGAIGQLTAPVKRMEEIFYRFKPMALRQYNRLMN